MTGRLVSHCVLFGTYEPKTEGFVLLARESFGSGDAPPELSEKRRYQIARTLRPVADEVVLLFRYEQHGGQGRASRKAVSVCRYRFGPGADSSGRLPYWGMEVTCYLDRPINVQAMAESLQLGLSRAESLLREGAPRGGGAAVGPAVVSAMRNMLVGGERLEFPSPTSKACHYHVNVDLGSVDGLLRSLSAVIVAPKCSEIWIVNDPNCIKGVRPAQLRVAPPSRASVDRDLDTDDFAGKPTVMGHLGGRGVSGDMLSLPVDREPVDAGAALAGPSPEIEDGSSPSDGSSPALKVGLSVEVSAPSVKASYVRRFRPSRRRWRDVFRFDDVSVRARGGGILRAMVYSRRDEIAAVRWAERLGKHCNALRHFMEYPERAEVFAGASPSWDDLTIDALFVAWLMDIEIPDIAPELKGEYSIRALSESMVFFELGLVVVCAPGRELSSDQKDVVNLFYGEVMGVVLRRRARRMVLPI